MRLICVGKELLSVGQNLTLVPLNHRRSGLEFQQPVAGLEKARKYNFITLNAFTWENEKRRKDLCLI
jgi:hypothetical protein